LKYYARPSLRSPGQLVYSYHGKTNASCTGLLKYRSNSLEVIKITINDLLIYGSIVTVLYTVILNLI
jgi:hypothetical protein